ncbi:MAG: DUF177 domain-containing protein, partial [Anaerolineae bacterium]
ATRQYELDGQLAELNDVNPNPVRFLGQVTLMRSALGVLATVDAQFEAQQECRRCLDLFVSNFTLHFEEEYLPTLDIETGLKVTLDQDADPVLLIDEHHIVDISELLRQYALVEMDESSLCKPDCKGLCPVCGQNLNLGTCTCDRKQIDQRLTVLAQLLTRDDDINRKEVSR